MVGILDILLGRASQQPQPNAQPESYQGAAMPQVPQAQPPQQRQGGGMGDFMSALGPAIAMLDPRNQQLGAHLMQMQQHRQKQAAGQQHANRTVEYLQSQGVSPQEAELIVSDPQMLRSWFGERAKAGKPDWQIAEIYDEQGRPKKVLIDKNNPQNMQDLGGSKAASGADGVEYGLNPIYGQDAQGNTVLGVLGKDGSFKPVDTGGVSVSTGVDRVDVGTHYVLQDKRSGQVVGTLSKENYQEAFDKSKGGAEGKAEGEANANLATDLATANQAIMELDQLIEHPGLSAIAGPIDQYRPSWTMGAEGRDALARYNQARGRAFLQAFGMLKGGGQITEIEGTKAEQAMARMDRAQSETDFKQALTDFRDAVKAGMEKMKLRAGRGNVSYPPSAQPGSNGTPAVGSVEGGYRFKGGNPADPNSWERQ